MTWDTLDFKLSAFNVDVTPSLLPDNTVNNITNIDFFAGYPRTLNNVASITVPTGAPLTLASYTQDDLVYTGYGTTTGIYAWSPLNTQINITPATGLSGSDYWDSTQFGPYGIFTNGIYPEDPHGISATATQAGTKAAPLPGWSNTWSTRLIRTHRNVLWAGNMTEGGVRMPTKVRWSTSSIANGLPSTWIPAPSNDAGSNELQFIGGEIVDMCAVGDVMYIGGTGGIWAARWVGGQYVYNFSQITSQNGPRDERCMVSLGDTAAVLTLNDLLIFDETSEFSLIVGRMTELVRSFKKAQMVYISSIRQLYIFYQLVNETGYQHALIWDRDTNTFGRRDFDQSYSTTGAIIVPVIPPIVTWTTAAGDWNTNLQPWDPAQNIFLSYVGANAQGIYSSSPTPDNWLIGKGSIPSPDGDIIRVRSLEVDITGVTPQNIGLRLGSSQSLDENITWGPTRFYPMGTKKPLRHDDLISGRYISWEVTGVGASRINGVRLYYKMKGEKP